jgi:Sec-independent protein secretion pathway component TatC
MPTATKPKTEAVMPLGDHLEELRTRLLFAIYGLIPILILALVFGKQLLGIMLQPLTDALTNQGLGSPQATGPLETFGAYLKVSFIATFVVGGPWLLYQLWLFVSPGLLRRERRFIYFLLPLSALLTTVGVIFLYKFVMPMMLAFFLSFGVDINQRSPQTAPLPPNIILPSTPVLSADPPSDTLTPGMYWINSALHEVRYVLEVQQGTPVIYAAALQKESGIRQDYRVVEYMSLLLSMLLAFAVSFQTPVVMLLLGWVGLLNHSFLNNYRKHALLVTAVVAGMLTPGDVGSMVLLWVPLYILWELGGLLLWLFPASRISGEPPQSPDSPESPDAAA